MGGGRQSRGSAECCAAEAELHVYEHRFHPIPTSHNVVQGSQMHVCSNSDGVDVSANIHIHCKDSCT